MMLWEKVDGLWNKVMRKVLSVRGNEFCGFANVSREKGVERETSSS